MKIRFQLPQGEGKSSFAEASTVAAVPTPAEGGEIPWSPLPWREGQGEGEMKTMFKSRQGE